MMTWVENTYTSLTAMVIEYMHVLFHALKEQLDDVNISYLAIHTALFTTQILKTTSAMQELLPFLLAVARMMK